MKKIWTKIEWIACILLIITYFTLLTTVVIHKVNPPSPVERNEIEELLITRDSLVNEINELDSIKNEKIIEIYNLDNDSTVKLFYKLVSNK